MLFLADVCSEVGWGGVVWSELEWGMVWWGVWDGWRDTTNESSVVGRLVDGGEVGMGAYVSWVCAAEKEVYAAYLA